ncbi:MAG: hypothetical protein KC561_16325, partial [Myxococcales bacterium]|nr:hypothetical protein [Myxococcales bacterium]
AIQRMSSAVPRVRKLALPAGLRAVLLAGGADLSTPSVIAALERLESEVRQPLLSRMSVASVASVAALESFDRDGFLRAGKEFVAAQTELAALVAGDIVSARTACLHGIASQLGGFCKPSGAGGDGLLVAVIPDSEHETFTAAAMGQGFTRLECLVDLDGWRRERRTEPLEKREESS